MDHATISKGMAIAALCTVAAASNTRAADAVFVASSISSQSSIETQGFAGRISLRTAPFGSAPSRDVLGATASDQMIYQLESTFGTSSSVIRGTTTHPGGGQLSITVNRPLSDIALIGSTLYGIINRSDAVEIVSIAPNGVLTPVVNYPITTYNGRWRLSGQVGGSALLAVRARTGSSLPADAYGALFDPSSGSLLSQLSIATQDTSTPVNRGAVADTVIAANGASFTALPADSFFAISPAPQPVYLLPSAAPQGNRPADQRYASTSINAMAVSDEFHYAFGPENDALADVSAVYSGQWGRLYRHPFVWQGSIDVRLANGLAPDGTTLSQVVAGDLIQQSSGGSPAQITEFFAAPGAFAARSVGTASIQLDLNLAQRGVYTFNARPILTASYTHDGTVEPARPITVRNAPSMGFAYDPVSSNLVGNGDLELLWYGWESFPTPGYSGASIALDGGDYALWFTTDSRTTKEAMQTLLLPTADQPMLFRFAYRLAPFPGGTVHIRALLNGISLADFDVTTASENYSTFETLITDPALFNRSNAVLRLLVSTSDPTAWAYIDDISLTAIPEPAVLVAGAGVLLLLPRRRR